MQSRNMNVTAGKLQIECTASGKPGEHWSVNVFCEAMRMAGIPVENRWDDWRGRRRAEKSGVGHEHPWALPILDGGG